MFGFIKKNFFTAITFFSYNVLNVNHLACVLMNNQECKIRSEIINVNTNEPIFYPYSITITKCKGSCNTINDPYAKLCFPDTIKCKGSCNTINDPYAKLCVPDTIKNINVKVFNVKN